MSTITAWRRKFSAAIAGIVWSVQTQNSFWIHLLVTTVVVVTAAWLDLEAWRWTAIVIAISLVITAELFNTAIEELVRVLHPEHDRRIGRVLDTAAGGVLVAAIASVAIGLLTLGPPLWQALVK